MWFWIHFQSDHKHYNEFPIHLSSTVERYQCYLRRFYFSSMLVTNNGSQFCCENVCYLYIIIKNEKAKELYKTACRRTELLVNFKVSNTDAYLGCEYKYNGNISRENSCTFQAFIMNFPDNICE